MFVSPSLPSRIPNNSFDPHSVKRSRSMIDNYIHEIQKIRNQALQTIDPDVLIPKPYKIKHKPRSLSFNYQVTPSPQDQRLYYKSRSNKKQRADQKYYRILIQKIQRQKKHKMKQNKKNDAKFEKQKNYMMIYKQYIQNKRKQDGNKSDSDESDENVVVKNISKNLKNIAERCRTSSIKKRQTQNYSNRKLQDSYQFLACKTDKEIKKRSSKQINKIFNKKFGDFALPHTQFVNQCAKDNQKFLKNKMSIQKRNKTVEQQTKKFPRTLTLKYGNRRTLHL